MEGQKQREEDMPQNVRILSSLLKRQRLAGLLGPSDPIPKRKNGRPKGDGGGNLAVNIAKTPRKVDKGKKKVVEDTSKEVNEGHNKVVDHTSKEASEGKMKAAEGTSKEAVDKREEGDVG
uniref:Uncharacterized protein n=1 Tax=Lactuca sativa TaxID=4236 RepID=A0A9R1XH46_LACSA|nr:hypothetical protein LSAT_V11C400181740 [Lactuca sativa]